MSESKIKIQEVDCTTGEEVFRDPTAEELAQIELDKVNEDKRKAAKVKAEADKAALLARLGLTEDELKTILG